MNISEEKRLRDNRCLKCVMGFLSCRIAEDGSGRWEEHCSNCDYTKIHICRRKEQKVIDFQDRRVRN